MKITPFQALTLLAQKYREESGQQTYLQIKKLYLSGVRTSEDAAILNKLLKDKSLSGYEIDDSKEAINNDAVRRYFEGVLCFETLNDSLDHLDRGLLEQNFAAMFARLPSLLMKIVIPVTIYQNKFMEIAEKHSDSAKEYAEAIQAQKDKYAPDQLQEDRKKKMILLAKSAHAGMTVISTSPAEDYPLNLYGAAGSAYSGPKRGRVPRKDEDREQVVKPHTLGIMRSFMPLPQDDPLYAEDAANYVRPADKSTYVEGAEQPENAFATKVTPFVNSISGTMLCQLRVMAQFLREGSLIYNDNPKQLQLYFQNFVAYMTYNSGGHSLDEFVRVFQLPEVIEEFKSVPGFEKLTLETLFKVENEFAFEKAVEKTIAYNHSILSKKQVHEELVQAKKQLKKPDLSLKTSLDVRELAINKAYNMYYDQSITAKQKQKARKTLVRFLDIDATNEKDIDKIIQRILIERAEKTRINLYSNDFGTLAKRLDKAWEIYQNNDSSMTDKDIAQGFLIYALNIANPEVGLNDAIAQSMLLRDIFKSSNPNYIPNQAALNTPSEESVQGLFGRRKVSIDARIPLSGEQVEQALRDKDLLDVAPLSKLKDEGKLTGKKTIFYNENERAMFQVMIHNGRFEQNGKAFDTSSYISHDKKGFAAFTLNANGELSVFNHIDHDKTGIAHSSMNAGAPVVSAGELRIDKGQITGITVHSGHYRPTVYSIYKTLEYFKKRHVDITNAEVFTFTDPSEHLDMVSSKSKKYPRFYVAYAEDICSSFKAYLRKELRQVSKDLEKYKCVSFLSLMEHLKGFFTGNKKQSEREKIVESMIGDISTLEGRISSAKNIEQLKAIIRELVSIEENVSKINEEITIPKKFGEKYKASASDKYFASYLGKLADTVSRLKDRAKEEVKKTDKSLPLEAHDLNALKGIKRK